MLDEIICKVVLHLGAPKREICDGKKVLHGFIWKVVLHSGAPGRDPSYGKKVLREYMRKAGCCTQGHPNESHVTAKRCLHEFIHTVMMHLGEPKREQPCYGGRGWLGADLFWLTRGSLLQFYYESPECVCNPT